jgi:hypothetical protein
MFAHYQRGSERPQLIDTSWQLAPTILSRVERISRNTNGAGLAPSRAARLPISRLTAVATHNVDSTPRPGAA